MIRSILKPAFLMAALALAVVPPAPAPAQEPAPGTPPAEGEGSGRPFDGYFATGVLAFLALFIVGKSARR